MNDPVKSKCQDRCAEFGEPACYEMAHSEGFEFEPCSDCLRDCGIEVNEPFDPNAAIGTLL